MEYSSAERNAIYQYWFNYYKGCPICHGKEDKTCQCKKMISASVQCELNGFGRKMLRLSLSNQQLRAALDQYYLNFQSNYTEGKGIYIFGQALTGKTLGLTELAKKIIATQNPYNLNSFNIRFFLYDDLVRYSYDEKSFSNLEIIIKKTDILVLDSIGSETGLKTAAKSSVTLLENILKNRDMNGKITWLTSLLSLNNLQNTYGNLIFNIVKNNFQIICSG